MTFLAGNAAYVMHSGPGIRGGGAAGRAKLGRHAHFDELPSFNAIAPRSAQPNNICRRDSRTGRATRRTLRRHRCRDSMGCNSASNGKDFIALAVGITLVLRARVSASIDVRQTTTGALIKHIDVSSGEHFTLSGDESMVLVSCCAAR